MIGLQDMGPDCFKTNEQKRQDFSSCQLWTDCSAHTRVSEEPSPEASADMVASNCDTMTAKGQFKSYC